MPNVHRNVWYETIKGKDHYTFNNFPVSCLEREMSGVGKYKSFAETFRFSSFALAISMMYPRRSNERIRLLITLLMLTTLAPGLVMYSWDLFSSFLVGDMDRFTRIATAVLPFILITMKMLLANFKRRHFEFVLNEISSDLISANDLSEDYQKIVDKHIKSGKIGETIWIVASLMVTGIFPTVAAILMVNHNLRNNETKRYMLFEVNFFEFQNDSPYFEIIFAYMLYLLTYFIANFIGFDGSFCIAVSHGALKLKLTTHRLKKLFEKGGDPAKIKTEMKHVIEEHERAYKYISHVQSVYGPWLAVLFLITLMQIAMTLYQITEVSALNPIYMIFVVGSINHIYLPCQYAAMLKETALESSTEIYCCGWEKVQDKRTTDTVRLMVARAQCPVIITAAGMVNFDMLLFVSMLQSSYSMFTLLTSG